MASKKQQKEWKHGNKIKMKIYGCGNYTDSRGRFMVRYNFPGKEEEQPEQNIIQAMINRIYNNQLPFDTIYIHRVIGERNHPLIAKLTADGEYVEL